MDLAIWKANCSPEIEPGRRPLLPRVDVQQGSATVHLAGERIATTPPVVSPQCQVGRVGDAITDYTEAIRLNPQEASSFYNRGLAWAKKGEHDEAIADFNEAIRLDSKNACSKQAFFRLGLAWTEKRDWDKSIAAYSEAIRLAPQFVDAFHNRGLSWERQGEHDKAIVDFNEVIRLAPQSADAYHHRACSWINKGEYDNAIADNSEAIRLNPLEPRTYNNRGNALQLRHEYQSAIADYTEAIRLDPENAARYTTLAWLLATCPDGRYRDGSKAVQLAEQAYEFTDDTDFDFLRVRAAAHAEKGDFDVAIAWLLQAIELAPSDEKDSMRECLKLYQAGQPCREE